MSALLAGLALTMLAAAARRDIITRTIPDIISLVLLIAGATARLSNGVSAITASAGAGFLLFALLFAAFSRGLLGGGDVKLMTALAVGLSPYDCYRFVVATAVAGGVLAALYLLLSRRTRIAPAITHRSLFRRILAVEGWRIRRRGPLPYAVAIAAGGAFVLLQPGG